MTELITDGGCGIASLGRADGEPPLRGLDGLIVGRPPHGVPRGAGLSSSSVLTVVVALALTHLNGWQPDGVTLARFCSEAEWYVGTRGGIMDQFISALGQENAALFVDCRTLEHRSVSIPHGYTVVIMDTAKQRGLADSAYNTRRAECEEGVRLLSAYLPGIAALRDVSVSQFGLYVETLPLNVRKRCRHVIGENQRVLDSVDALMRGDVAAFGRLMDASHRSLRDDYEVSCAELDAMVEAAWRAPGIVGARMTGAGFGGCAVALVEGAHATRFRDQVAAEYRSATGLEPNLYICTAEQGASVVR